MLDALASDARTRIATVRSGLQAILAMLAGEPGTRVVVVDDYQLEPPQPAAVEASKGTNSRAVAARRAEPGKPVTGHLTIASHRQVTVFAEADWIAYVVASTVFRNDAF